MVLYILLFVPIDVSYVGRNGVSILAVTLIAMRSIVWYMRFLGVYFLLLHNPCVCFRIKIHYYGLAKYIEFCSFILLAGSGTRLESEKVSFVALTVFVLLVLFICMLLNASTSTSSEKAGLKVHLAL